MKIRDIAEVIERYAPLRLQESYDNAGLIVGRPEDEVHQALLAVDVTEEVLDEAEQTGCDLIVTHHRSFSMPSSGSIRPLMWSGASSGRSAGE